MGWSCPSLGTARRIRSVLLAYFLPVAPEGAEFQARFTGWVGAGGVAGPVRLYSGLRVAGRELDAPWGEALGDGEQSVVWLEDWGRAGANGDDAARIEHGGPEETE